MLEEPLPSEERGCEPRVHAMLHHLAGDGDEAEELGVHEAIMADVARARVDVMAETPAAEAAIPHPLEGLGREEEGPPASAVPVVGPLVEDEPVQAAGLVGDGLVVEIRIHVPGVVNAEVLDEVHAVDRVPAPRPQSLGADHHDGAPAVLRVPGDGPGDVLELGAEIVRRLLVHRQLEREQPPRVPGAEDGRPAALLEGRAQATQEDIEFLRKQGLRPRDSRDVHRHEERDILQRWGHRGDG
mmetsp:Transcript_1623/g.4440  ORF Transcript_1623/g.4440 Transcript_1623/m.4440 type:complete len:242 (-) Transcript_1623:393-1118(-)